MRLPYMRALCRGHTLIAKGSGHIAGILYACHMSISHLNEVLASPEMLESLKRRFSSKVKAGKPNECWPWIAKATAKYGYGRMTAGRGRYLRAHQVAWALENGPIPEGSVVLHSCDNPACCNPRHMSIGTQAENMAEARDRKRAASPPRHSGETHPMAKLSDSAVAEIRRGGTTLEQAASQFGVSVKTIWRIRNKLQRKQNENL